MAEPFFPLTALSEAQRAQAWDLCRHQSLAPLHEMCDACRRYRFVGVGYGPPGTGKTESAKYYAQWSLIKPFLPEPLITFAGRSAEECSSQTSSRL